jgi:peptidyl-prolyl cis-trans isomerase SurA
VLPSGAVLGNRGHAGRLVALLLVAAGTAVAAAAPQATLRDRVVAVVDGDPLLDSDLDRAIVLSGAARAAGESERTLRRRVLDALIEERLRIHEVERYGFEQVPVEMIAEQVAAIRARFPSDEVFRRRLQALGMQLEGLERLVAQQLQVMVYVDELLGARVFVGLEEIEAYYAQTLVPQLRAAGKPVPPLDEVREQIREVLRQGRLNQELERWTTELRRRADVEDYFERPERPLPPKVGEKARPRAQSALPPPSRPPPLRFAPPLSPRPPAPRGAGGAPAHPRSFPR